MVGWGDHEVVGQRVIEYLWRKRVIEEDPSRIGKVIIEIPFDDVPQIYIQRIGTQRLLGVEFPPLRVVTGDEN